MAHLLSVQDLHTSFFTDAGEVQAVNGVSFNLDEGEILGIVGESGSGKSVTAYSIMRILADAGKIVSGKILYKGQDLAQFSEKEMQAFRGKCCSIIFQDPMTSLNPVFTIGSQMKEAVVLHTDKRGADADARVVELLELVGINEPQKRVRQYPFELSGGMRQRVMIAMALACEPDILIADEPTTALDVTIQAQILELMQELQKKMGMAVILVTHDLGVIADMCDNIVVMYGGRICERGTAHEIFYNPKHEYTKGLLRSIPNVNNMKKKLVPISGTPINMLNMPKGCAFCARCDEAMKICLTEVPEEIEEVRAYTKAHGIRLAGKNAWPQFERYRPHKMRWKVEDPEDREHLADALEAGIELGRLFAEDPAAAAELGFNDVRLGDIREVPLLRRNDGVYVIDGTASLPQPAEEDYPKGPAPDPDTVKKLKSKFRKGAIECGVIWLPQPVQEAEDQVPYYPVMLMAVQAHSGMVLPVEIVKDYDNDREELLSNFLRALGTQKNLPKLWKVHDMRTYRLLDAAAESLGAKLELHDRMDLRALAEAQDALMESMGFGSVYDDDNTFSDLEEMLNGMEYVVNELHVEIPGDIQEDTS